MEEIKLQDISIKEYTNLLRSGVDPVKLSAIDKLLGEELRGVGNGNDIALFIMQKDMLVFQCKLAIAFFEFDDSKKPFYEKKIKELREQIEKKTAKKDKQNPYKAFLSWILSVEKFLRFSIDRNNDLAYLCEATKQMISNYEMQKANIEKNKVKK